MSAREFFECEPLYRNVDRQLRGDILKNTPREILDELDIIGRWARLIKRLNEMDLPAYDHIKAMYDQVMIFQKEIENAKELKNTYI